MTDIANAGQAVKAGASKHLTTCGWDDVPHIDKKTQEQLLASTPPHLRAARKDGTPSLGSGAIYPIEINDILCDPFPLPAYWPRSYALDVGWNRTAALWGAHDRDTDCVYLYSEHYRGQAEPAVHARAIEARGSWVPGVVDPAARGRSQTDGKQLLAMYRQLGLKLIPADNSVESGIYEVFERLSTGRLKVFRTLTNWQAEYRIYRRDENGKIVKKFDHLMDTTRYLIVSGLKVAVVQPAARRSNVAPLNIADPLAGY